MKHEDAILREILTTLSDDFTPIWDALGLVGDPDSVDTWADDFETLVRHIVTNDLVYLGYLGKPGFVPYTPIEPALTAAIDDVLCAPTWRELEALPHWLRITPTGRAHLATLPDTGWEAPWWYPEEHPDYWATRTPRLDVYPLRSHRRVPPMPRFWSPPATPAQEL